MRVVLAICAYTGLRKGDALTLTKAAYDAESGGIAANTAKTGQKVQWPVIAPLRAVLDVAPVHDAITLAATSKGRPWSVSGFDTAWQQLRTRLEAEGEIEPGLTLHGRATAWLTSWRKKALTHAPSPTRWAIVPKKWPATIHVMPI